MTTKSNHIEKILNQHNQICSMQVVFCDIESYSKRRTRSQIDVINALTAALRNTVDALAAIFSAYLATNHLNLATDLIIIPTGDGVLVAFTFDGLHDIHLQFARVLLTILNAPKEAEHCQHFDEHGWCNCHNYVNLRIGVADGKCIIYEDVNGRYNVAGGVVNLASRVMNLAERNQIVFSESAFRQLIDMIEDPKLGERFVEAKDCLIKHGEKITVYRYNVLPTFTYTGDLTVHEKVEANFNVSGSLIIEEKGFIVGNVSAKRLTTKGKVHGSVKVGLCELCNGSELIGNLICSRLLIDEGATFLGTSTIVVGETP